MPLTLEVALYIHWKCSGSKEYHSAAEQARLPPLYDGPMCLSDE